MEEGGNIKPGRHVFGFLLARSPNNTKREVIDPQKTENMKKHRTINGIQRDQYEKMVYGFLRELYAELRRTENLYGQVSPMLKQHGMPSNMLSRLRGMGILKSKTHGRYQWIGQPPSLDMADAIISYYSASDKPKRPVTTSTLYQNKNGKKTTRYRVHIGSWSFMIPKIPKCYVQKIEV